MSVRNACSSEFSATSASEIVQFVSAEALLVDPSKAAAAISDAAATISGHAIDAFCSVFVMLRNLVGIARFGLPEFPSFRVSE